MARIPNQVSVVYYFNDEPWDYIILITPEHIEEYYGMPVHKDLFAYIDFDKLMEQDYGFSAWIRKKYEDDVKLEYERYYL